MLTRLARLQRTHDAQDSVENILAKNRNQTMLEFLLLAEFLKDDSNLKEVMKRACKIGLSSCYCRSCKPVTQCYTVNKLLELKYLWLGQFDVTLIVSWVLP